MTLGCESVSVTTPVIGRGKIETRPQGATVRQAIFRMKHCQILKSKTIIRRKEGILTHQGQGFKKLNSHHPLLFLAPHLKGFT